MLIIATKLSDIRFSDLMEVYLEGNTQNGSERYPAHSPQQQLLFAEQDFYQYLQEVFFRQKHAVYALWQAGSRYTAALRLEPYLEGLLISALETRPDDRHKGYATMLINAVIDYLAADGGGILYSHVSKHNKASIVVHQKCGFEKILDHAVYLDGSVMNNCYTFQINI